MISHESISVNRFGCLEPGFVLWVLFFYPVRFVLYLMPVIRQMLGSWTEVESSIWYMPASVVSLLLLYTWFNRIPDSGLFWRWVWHRGRWVLLCGYLWSACLLLWLNSSVWQRTDHRHFEAVVVLLLINILAIHYLLVSKRVRQVFSEFPQAIDSQSQRVADESKAVGRQQWVRQARLHTPIAQNDTQQTVEAHWRAEAAKDPLMALPWIELGVMAYQNGQHDLALAMMEHAQACEPDNPLVLKNLGEIYRQQGIVQRALVCGRRVVELWPNDATARLHLALALTDAQDIKSATAQYHKLIELEPQNVQAWCALAALLLKVQRLEDAKIAIDAIRLLDAEHPAIKAYEATLVQAQHLRT